MDFVLVLLIAGIIIWLFNKVNNKGNRALDKNKRNNDISFLQTIQDNSIPASTKNIPSPESDMEPQSIIPIHIDDKREEIKKTDLKPSKNDRWISPGSSINITDYSVLDGMIYVGKDLPAVYGYGTECALINPNLKIDKSNDDYLIRRLNYWPSYSEASPDARASYLNWLSNGKNDPHADIGYVFLYFYGLERRLLYETVQGLVSDAEIRILIKEVNRLLDIYGQNGSFHSYATSLLTYVQANDYIDNPQYKNKVPSHTQHFGLPLDLQIYLGQMVKDDVPIPAEWALAWYLSTPNPPVYTRTPAHRCKQEFHALFTAEYTRCFGAGMRLKDNKSRIKIEHRPASKSLMNLNYAKTLDLPDVTKQTSFVNKIAPLIQSCQDQLDSYSRYLGRNPEGKDSFDAILELPISIWPDKVKEFLDSLQTMILQEKSISMKFSTFLDYFPVWQDKSKKHLIQFFERLESCHIGIEPDLRYSGIKPESEMTVLLFSLDESASNPGPSYHLAALAMHLAAMVSQSDGEVTQVEISVLEEQIERSLNLHVPEIKRLKIHLQWLLSQPLSVKGLKKRIQSMQIGEREQIGNLLIQVSQADGTVSGSEIKLLEKIFTMLEIDPDILYSKIHSSYAEPITVKQAEAVTAGFSIPVPPQSTLSAESKFSLDMNKVAALHTDTQDITALLNTIFNPDEEEQNAPSTQTIKDPEPHKSWGLDPSIYQFVEILMKKSTWERRELEELAYNKKLMLEGILEQINEAAFEYYNEPFIEGV